MLPEAHLVHSIDRHRLRLRIPEHRRHADYFARIKAELEKHPGIKSVIVNAVSASVLILHELAMEEIQEFAEENELFRFIVDVIEPVPLSERLAGHYHSLGESFKNATGGSLDIKGVAILALAAASGYQMLRKKTLPEGVSLLWYATTLLQHREPPRR